MECIFCKIVKKEIPSAVVYEDDKVLAFLDIAPVNKGHTLVVPKEHYETLMDIPEDSLSKTVSALKKVSTAVMQGVKADGISVSMSNYRAAGQVIPHAHIHVIPRFEDDGLKLWPQGSYSDGEIEEFKNKIVKFLKE